MLRTVFMYLLLFIRQSQGWSLVTTRKVHEASPPPELLELAEIYDSQDIYRLNDPTVGLTALKDKNFVSCFVNDFDPLWLPAPADKEFIINNQPCEKVNKNTDLATLRNKAGPKIASMCKDLYVFWLAARNMEPPPLPGMFRQESRHCEFDDDLPNSNPSMVLPDDKSSRTGSGLQPFPDTQEVIKPPMLPINPGTNENKGSSPELQENAPPMIGAPPMLRNQEVPASNDGAPPMIGENEPPLIDGGAPPMFHEGPPPMLKDNAPPMSHDGPPPMLKDNAQPISHDGPPPIPKDGDIAPPLAANVHSRRDLDVPATPMQVTYKRPPPVTLADMLKKFKDNRAQNVYAIPTPDMRTPPPPKPRRYM